MELYEEIGKLIKPKDLPKKDNRTAIDIMIDNFMLALIDLAGIESELSIDQKNKIYKRIQKRLLPQERKTIRKLNTY